MSVEKALDELWIGVKGQSNLEISCTLRNNFRVSLRQEAHRGRALDPRGRLPPYRREPNSEYYGRGLGDRLWGISFIVKRGTAQTVD